MNAPDETHPALRALFDRRTHGMKLGLGRMTGLLDAMDHPERAFLVAHVAGTNGKGSVCAMIEAALREAGYRTGLYTSPHLVQFNERIRIEGRPVTDAELIDALQAVDAAETRLNNRPATFFEMSTALAFSCFRERRVQIAVVETGMGGRFDATNVVTPLLSVLTPCSLEHTRYLGSRIEDIVREKCGIVKRGRPVVTVGMAPEAMAVVRRTCARCRAPLTVADETGTVRRIRHEVAGQTLVLETGSTSYPPIRLPLAGPHQRINALLAAGVIDRLNESLPRPIEPEAVRRSWEALAWPGRFQPLETDPPVILDVAHNPAGAGALARTLREHLPDRPVALIAGLLDDKDAAGFFRALAPAVARCWITPIDDERGAPPEALRAAAARAGLQPEIAEWPRALESARAWARTLNGAVCIAGSLYLAGEVLRGGVRDTGPASTPEP